MTGDQPNGGWQLLYCPVRSLRTRRPITLLACELWRCTGPKQHDDVVEEARQVPAQVPFEHHQSGHGPADNSVDDDAPLLLQG